MKSLRSLSVRTIERAYLALLAGLVNLLVRIALDP